MEFDPQLLRWRLDSPDWTLQLALRKGRLLSEYFGPRNAQPSNSEIDEARLHRSPEVWIQSMLRMRDEIGLALAPDYTSPAWALHEWTQVEDGLRIVLRSDAPRLECRALFRIDPSSQVLIRENQIQNLGDQPVSLRRLSSFAALLPGEFHEGFFLVGSWGEEAQRQSFTPMRAILKIENTAGRSTAYHAPYLCFHSPTHTCVAQLYCSGNWQMETFRSPDSRVSVWGGLQESGLRWELATNETAFSPRAVIGLCAGDINDVTHRIHEFRRQQRKSRRSVPVHFDTWLPLGTNVAVAPVKELAQKAAGLGCEVLMVDAGWFTAEKESPGEVWWHWTGDWIPNPKFYPNGLEELSNACRDLGIGLGLWFEPEAVGPSTRIWREHPEWLHQIDGQPITDILGLGSADTPRGLLHLGVPAAREFITEKMIAILRATNAQWLKWDFNQHLYQGGWSEELPESLRRMDPLVAHYQGLYQLQATIRNALPHICLEMCASGGLRSDGETTLRGDTVWISDEFNAVRKLAIHFGSQLSHAPEECNDWLVEWPASEHDKRGDLGFRLHVAMLGSFGMSFHPDKWTDDELDFLRGQIARYKTEIRPLMERSRQYFLTPPPPLSGEAEWAGVFYWDESSSKGLLFAFRLASAEITHTWDLPLPGGKYRHQSELKDNFRSELVLIEPKR